MEVQNLTCRISNVLIWGWGALLLFGAASLVSAAPGQVKRISGPFGTIETCHIFLEPPDSLAEEKLGLVMQDPELRWSFSKSLSELKSILLDCGMATQDVESLLNEQRIVLASDEETVVRPDFEAVLNLPRAARERLYPLIGPLGDSKNTYFNPYPLWRGGFAAMAAVNSGLSPERIETVTRLEFQTPGGKRQFSDIKLVLAQATSDEERLRIFKTLRRKESLRASLDLMAIAPGQRNAVAEYWAADGKNASAGQFLRSVFASGSLTRISLGRLLPPRCRELLHSYPDIESSRGEDWPDCFSTAYSFFAREFSFRFYDRGANVIRDQYEAVQGPPRFGDVLILKNREGRGIHACNYIAGDIVFTKNGQSSSNPWIFQHFSDLLYVYKEEMSDPLVSIVRLKPQFRQ